MRFLRTSTGVDGLLGVLLWVVVEVGKVRRNIVHLHRRSVLGVFKTDQNLRENSVEVLRRIGVVHVRRSHIKLVIGSKIFVVVVERKIGIQKSLVEQTSLECPSSGNVSHGVPSTSKNHGWHVKAFHKAHTVSVSAHRQVETSKFVTGKRVTSTLKNNGRWLIPVHNFLDHRLKDRLVRNIVNSVSQRHVDGIVFSLANTNISELTCTREKFSVLVERAGHHTICGIEGLFDTVTMVHIGIDVQDTWMVSQKLDDSQNNVIDITKPRGLGFFSMVQTSGVIDGDIAFSSVESGGTFHGSSSRNTTVLKQTIKHRTVVSNVELGLLFGKHLQVVRSCSGKEVNVLVRVELAHLLSGCRLCPVNLHLLVQTIVHDQRVRHPYSMWFHRMCGTIRIIPHIGIVEIRNSLLVVWIDL